jgi:hypothetical protein
MHATLEAASNPDMTFISFTRLEHPAHLTLTPITLMA